MQLLIFDPHDRGHYLAYVRHMLQGAPPSADVTLVVCQGASRSVAFQQQLQPHVSGVRVDEGIRPESYRNGKQLLEDFSAACDRHVPDHIWIPSGDLLFKAATLAHAMGRWRLPKAIEAECGLIEIRCHRPPRRWRGHARVAWDRAVLLAGGWTKVYTIDPTVLAWSKARGGLLSKRIHAMPDPVDTFERVSKDAARRSLDIPLSGRYVATVGVHAIPRKGTQLLVESFSRAALSSTDRLLVAGPLGDVLRSRLDSEFAGLVEGGRIVTLDRYLDAVELMNAFAAADVVCTPYIDHLGSSAVVLQAAQLGRPVLAPHQGWFAEMIPKFGLGTTGAILEPDALATALQSILERSEVFTRSEASRRLLEYSDAANFGRLWASRLRERMALPPDPEKRTWDWVMRGFPTQSQAAH
jgi:glycosyltransferase involved in cell wall biosynthesis